jgi:hypothetical protein
VSLRRRKANGFSNGQYVKVPLKLELLHTYSKVWTTKSHLCIYMAVARFPTDALSMLEDPDTKQARVMEMTIPEEDMENEMEDVESDASDTTELSEDSQKVVPSSVLEDIRKFETTFKDLTMRYRIMNRIGEGMQLSLPSAQD